MKLRIACVVVGLLSLVVSLGAQTAGGSSAVGQVPPVIQFSSVATDIHGKPLTAVVGITFYLYKEQQGGAPLWLETQNVQPDKTGRYTVLLGSTTSQGLPASIFATGEAHWLGVQLQGQEEQPRALLASAPYALKAADAETIGGLPVSAFVLAAPSGGNASASSSSSFGSGGNPANIGGSGTKNYIPLWTDNSGNLGNSVLYQLGAGSSAKIGINEKNPLLTLDVNGSELVRGLFEMATVNFANPTKGYNSQPFNLESSAYNSGTAQYTLNHFQWQAEPTGNNTTNPSATLNLLFGVDPATPTETGLKISHTGLLTFATGQKFPGTGTITGVTAGTGLSGGGSSGNVTLSLLTSCASGQILQWNGTLWVCSNAGSGTITQVKAGTDLTGGGNSGSVTLNLDTTKVPQLNSANNFTASQMFNGNARQMIVGDPGCGSGFAGIGFGALSGCNNYALVGDGTNTYINRPTGGSIFFRENNGSEMTIAPGGAVAITESLSGVFAPALNATSKSEGSFGMWAFGGGGSSESGTGGGGLLAEGGTETNTDSMFGGDGVDTYGGGAFQGGIGVYAQGGTSTQVGGGDGIDAYAGTGPTGNGYSGFFSGGDVNILGNLGVSGQIFAGTKDFRIDHPLDPANKYLYHASVESSEMMNIYTGNVTLDGSGAATVELPEWFEAVNGDFRYQLTAIGAAAPNLHIAQEVASHRFSIAGGAAGMKVSWQVTGVRHDAFAQANPLVVEVEKAANERGFYLHPGLYGQPAEKQIEWGRFPAKMRRNNERRAQISKLTPVKE